MASDQHVVDSRGFRGGGGAGGGGQISSGAREGEKVEEVWRTGITPRESQRVAKARRWKPKVKVASERGFGTGLGGQERGP